MTVIIITVVIISSHDQYILTGCVAKDAMMIVIINHGTAKDAMMTVNMNHGNLVMLRMLC